VEWYWNWSGMGVRTPVKLSSDLLDLLVNLSCVCDVCGCSQLSCSHTPKKLLRFLQCSFLPVGRSTTKHCTIPPTTRHKTPPSHYHYSPYPPPLLLSPPVSPSNRHHNTTHYFPRCCAHRFFFYISSFYSICSKNCNRTQEPA
jgi:hypothetical protein